MVTSANLNLFFEVPPQQASGNRCEVVELHQISRADMSECRARDGGCRQYTLSHAHFSQFSQSSSYLALYITLSTCTHVRVAGDLPRTCCVNICTCIKVILSRHVSSSFDRCSWLFLFRLYCTATKDDLNTDWREPGKPQSLLRAEGCCLALWPKYNALKLWASDTLVKILDRARFRETSIPLWISCYHQEAEVREVRPAPQFDQRSTKEAWARHKAWKLHEEVLNIKKGILASTKQTCQKGKSVIECAIEHFFLVFCSNETTGGSIQSDLLSWGTPPGWTRRKRKKPCGNYSE